MTKILGYLRVSANSEHAISFELEACLVLVLGGHQVV